MTILNVIFALTVVFAIWFYGKYQYFRGVMDTRKQILKELELAQKELMKEVDKILKG